MPETKRLYNFTEAKYALQNIERHRLKCSDLGRVNDPYESFSVMFSNCQQEKSFSEVRKEFIEKTGAVSFSDTFRDPILWGHYADNCKGIALGFDVQCDYGPTTGYAKKVKYVKHKIDICEIGMKFSGNELSLLKTVENMNERSRSMLLMNLLLTKSHNWSYEKEWRLLSGEEKLELEPVSGLYFCPFADRLRLREILIGFRCEELNIKRRVERLIDDDAYPDPKPEISCTRLSRSAFQIDKVT